MISDVVRPPAEQLRYRHVSVPPSSAYRTLLMIAYRGEGVVQIVRREGTTALLRGLGPNVVRAMLMNASQLATSVVVLDF